MKEIVLKESDVSKLKEYPLDGVISSEGKIYYYKRDADWVHSHLLKRLYRTDEKRVHRKILTIDDMQRSELSTYKELVIPEEVVMIQGIQSGFTIEEVADCMNLHVFLKQKNISNKDKIEVLKKIGKLLQKVQSGSQEFYFGDLQEYNFLVDKNKDVFAVDLDSAATTKKIPLESRYISIDKKTHFLSKYKVNKSGKCYPNKDIDTFCYNTLVMNFLAGIGLNRLSYSEYYDYIRYLEYCKMPKKLTDILINHYTDKRNDSLLECLDDLPLDYARTNYKVYTALQKTKK